MFLGLVGDEGSAAPGKSRRRCAPANRPVYHVYW